MRKLMLLAACGSFLAGALLILPGAASAQSCCSVTSIDQKSGVVSAKENATGRAFQFKVGGGKLLGSLRPGQAVYANFRTDQVSLDGKTACCSILSGSTLSGERTPEPGSKQAAAKPTVASKGGQEPQPTPIKPTEDITESAIRGLTAATTPASAPAPAGQACCTIQSIDSRKGMATAADSASGRTFRFKVTDARLLESLKVGQAVWANFAARKISVDGTIPCCEIK